MKENGSDFELAFFERLVKDNPNFVDALIPLAEVYTRKGLYEQGLKIDRKLARLKKADPIVHYNLACSLALVGEIDGAVAALKRAVRLGYRDLDHMRRDPDLKALHQDPRFGLLVEAFQK